MTVVEPARTGVRERRAPRSGRSDYVLKFLLAYLTYVVALHVAYVYLISPDNAYQGFTYRTPTIDNYLVAIAVAAAVGVALPQRVEHVSDLMLWVLYFGAGVPAMVLPQYIPVLTPDQASLVGFRLAACFILVRVLARVRPRIGLARFVAWLRPHFYLIAFAFAAALLFSLAIGGNLSLRFLDLYDVYDVRSEFEARNQGRLLLGYLAPVQFYVLGPALIAIGLAKKRYWIAWAAAVGQILLYSSVGHKTILFSVVGVIALSFALRNKDSIRGRSVLTSIAGATSVIVLFDLSLGQGQLSSLFVRRLLVLPGVLSSAYTKVFAQSSTNFSDVFGRIPSDYTIPPARVVGKLFFGSESVNANASLWMHGFASYGFLGMLVESLVLAVVLWLVDDVTSDLPLRLAMGFFLMPAVAIGESSIFTALLTHGVVAAIFFAAIMPRPASGAPPPRDLTSSRRAAPRRRRATLPPPRPSSTSG